MTRHRKTILRLILLVSLFLTAAARFEPIQTNPVQPFVDTETPVSAIVLIESSSQAELDATAEAIRSLGGEVYSTLPNRALFAWLTPSEAEAARSVPQVRLVRLESESLEPLPLDKAGGDIGAQAAILSWNDRMEAIKHPESLERQGPLPKMPDNDARSWSRPLPGEEDASLLPIPYDTSDYMIGSIQIDVFLPESNGSIDPNTENWTLWQIVNVTNEVTAGVNWWAATATQGGRPSANLSFNLVFHTPQNESGLIATSYEPISRPRVPDEKLWIGEIMTKLGYPQEYMEAVNLYNHDRRTQYGRDWGVSIFVVNSGQDADGVFADEWFAFSYYFGPFILMTYDNDGWTIDDMEIVTAHEMAHSFGALDEYLGECSDAQVYGYLGVQNTNCEQGDPSTEDSIMRSYDSQIYAYQNHLASTPVRGMVGWRDSDSDGLYDPIDTIPWIDLEALSPDPTGDTTPTFVGYAQDIGWVSPILEYWYTINYISSVQYRIDYGAWAACAPDDGSFDSYDENYSCTTPELSPGEHNIQVRAVNNVNNTSFLTGDTFTISGGSAGPANIYLPLTLLMKPALVNGGFESGPDAGWSFESLRNLPIIWGGNPSPPAHSGDWQAIFGINLPNETSRIWQEVTIAPNRYLQFWYQIISQEDRCTYDFATVKFAGSELHTFPLCRENNTDYWETKVIDLSPYTGLTGDLEFSIETDISNGSIFFLDDVAIISAAQAEIQSSAP